MSDQSILFIHALTGLHPGGGAALGVIDLSIRRERHTNWPIVPGTTLKGVLRSEYNKRTGQAPDKNPEVLALFGPPTGSSSEHAGALTLSDARILAFPVRSLSGVFAWVTCSAVLERLQRDLSIAGVGPLPRIPKPGPNRACCPSSSPLVARGTMILEEFEFSCSEDGGDISGWMAGCVTADKPSAERIRDHLVVLHDDDFTHFVSNATEVVARIGLDYHLKTVRQSALFYEEYLPAETLLYSLLICQDSHRAEYPLEGHELLQKLNGLKLSHVQIGGGETIGKGICAIHFFPCD